MPMIDRLPRIKEGEWVTKEVNLFLDNIPKSRNASGVLEYEWYVEYENYKVLSLMIELGWNQDIPVEQKNCYITGVVYCTLKSGERLYVQSNEIRLAFEGEWTWRWGVDLSSLADRFPKKIEVYMTCNGFIWLASLFLTKYKQLV